MRVIIEIGKEFDVEMVGGTGSTCNRKSRSRVPLRISGRVPNTPIVGHDGDGMYVFLSFQCAAVMGPSPSQELQCCTTKRRRPRGTRGTSLDRKMQIIRLPKPS